MAFNFSRDTLLGDLLPTKLRFLIQILSQEDIWLQVVDRVKCEDGTCKISNAMINIWESSRPRMSAEHFINWLVVDGCTLEYILDICHDLQLVKDFILNDILHEKGITIDDDVKRATFFQEKAKDPNKFSKENYSNVMSFENLKAATNNFDERPLKEGGNLLGEGGFGQVFFADMMNCKYAVKRFYSSDVPVNLETISGLDHPNILSLVTHLISPRVLFVYHYMEKGSLRSRLLDKSVPAMPFRSRLKPMIGISDALIYLHEKELIHRDVSSTNILLQENDDAVLGDFDLIRVFSQIGNGVSVTRAVVGCNIYLSPEATNNIVSEKMDVYSFGVVLLEVVSAKLVHDEEREDCIDLVTFCQTFSAAKVLDERMDSTSSEIIGLAEEILKLAKRCLSYNSKDRPTMSEVHRELLALN